MSVGIKNALSYKTSMVLYLVFRIINSIIMILVWTAIYINTKATVIGGFTLPFMYTYFFLFAAFGALTNSDMSPTMQDDIERGGIATSLLRPTNYVLQIFFNSLSSVVLFSLMVAVPLFILISFFTHFTITASMVTLIVIEVILGFTVYTVIDFLIGTLAVYLVNIWGILNVIYYILGIISGQYFPLNLFPSGIRDIVLLLPFQMFGYTEVATLYNIMPLQSIIISIIICVLWIAVLAVIAKLQWKRVLKKISAVGG